MALTETSEVLETTLNIPPSDMLRPIDEVLMARLTDRYVGYCERKCLVIGVKKILQRSSVRMAKSRLDGSGDVSVRFEVAGNVLYPGDLLAGCVVKNITGNNVTCTHPKVTLTIDAPSLARLLQVGNAITVEISEASYPLGSETITASGILYYNPPKTILFKTQYPANAETSAELLQQMQRTMARLGDARRNFAAAPERKECFRSMYYSYKTPLIESSLPKGVHVVKIVDIALELLNRGKSNIHNYGDGEMLLISHVLLDTSLGGIFQVDPSLITTDPIQGPEIFEFRSLGEPVYAQQNLIQVLCNLMDKEIKYLRMLTEMAHFYENESVFKHNSKIWERLDARRADQPTKGKKGGE